MRDLELIRIPDDLAIVALVSATVPRVMCGLCVVDWAMCGRSVRAVLELGLLH